MGMTRAEIDLAVSMIDKHMLEVVADGETQAAWRAVRGELRRTRKQSEQMLPRISVAAQHAALAGSHAQKSLDALGGVVSPTHDTLPPPKPDEET